MELTIRSRNETPKYVTNTDRYWVTYADGQKCIDTWSGNFSFILGFSDQDVLNAIRNNPVSFVRGCTGDLNKKVDALREVIYAEGNWSGLAWAVSGSDAVESAIAMNDAYWKKLGQNRPKILSFVAGYHGVTMLAKHLVGEYPELGRAEVVLATPWSKYEDRATAEKETLNEVRLKLEANPDIGCIVLESLVWSNNIEPYSTQWWQEIKRLCDVHNVLMIVDDVAMCWGSLGHLFSYKRWGIQPDIVAIGKSFTGGYSPLSATVCNQRVIDVIGDTPWHYTQTWSPNMWGVEAALAVTKKVNQMLDRVPNIHNKLLQIGDSLGLYCRAQGLMIAYDFDYELTPQKLSSCGLSSTYCYSSHVKVSAPLIADDEYFDALHTGLKKVLQK